MQLGLGLGLTYQRGGSAAPSLPNYFEGDFTTQPNSASAVWPSAVYDSATDTTYYAWLAEGSPQVVRIAAYDHVGGVWSEPVTITRQTSFADDTHGNPSIAIDHQGYIYVFWGSHVSNQLWAISAAPGDISAWNVQSALTGSYAYPKPVRFGTDLYLFLRVGSTSDSKFVVRKASPSGGVASFGSEVNLVDWTADNIGVYVAEVRAIGSEIEFMFCQQTGSSPQVRKHLFYAAWNPSTGALRNLDSSTTVASGSLPVLHALAASDFREFDSGSNITEIPSWCRDGSGDLHVIFFDGSSDPYPLKHMIWASGSWSSPATVLSLDGRDVPRIRYVSLFRAGSTVELWYPVGENGAWTSVGGDDMARRVWSGTWGSEEIIVAGDEVRALAHPCSVHDADPDLRVIFGESAQTEAYNDRFLAKRYGHGSGGLTDWPEVTDPYRSRVIEEVVYQGTDNSTPANLDRSWVGDPLTWTGNAKITSNRLALDGTGDYTSLGANLAISNRRYYMNGTANKNSGEFCIDLRRIAFTTLTTDQAIWSRYLTTGNQRSILVIFRGSTSPKRIDFVYSLNGSTTTTVSFNWTPTAGVEYDFRISRDASGTLRLHYAVSGSDLVMQASSSIGTSEFFAASTRVTHGATNAGAANTMNGSIGATRVTLSDRGTTNADVSAADMAFDA